MVWRQGGEGHADTCSGSTISSSAAGANSLSCFLLVAQTIDRLDTGGGWCCADIIQADIRAGTGTQATLSSIKAGGPKGKVCSLAYRAPVSGASALIGAAALPCQAILLVFTQTSSLLITALSGCGGGCSCGCGGSSGSGCNSSGGCCDSSGGCSDSGCCRCCCSGGCCRTDPTDTAKPGGTAALLVSTQAIHRQGVRKLAVPVLCPGEGGARLCPGQALTAGAARVSHKTYGGSAAEALGIPG